MRHSKEGETLTYGGLVKQLGEQGLGMLAILFALPSALPISVIPGFSFIFGLPIVFIALHLMIGRHSLWLPKSLSSRAVDRAKLIQLIKKTLPGLLFVERLLKPRWPFFSRPAMEKVHGLILLIMSLLLLLPIPFSNFIFASLIICFGLGIAVQDGVFLAMAYVVSFIYLFFLNRVLHVLFTMLFTA